MAAENVTVGLSLLGSAFLVYVLCIPLLKDQIKPNAFYGIRLPKSFESRENWYKMNRYGARQLMNWSWPMMICGAVALFLPLQRSATLTLLLTLLPTLLLIVPLIQIFRYSKTL